MARKVLFVCTGNTCRSPMATALLQHLLREKAQGRQITVESAGLHAHEGAPAAAAAQRVLQEMGIDLSYHRARSVDDAAVEEADLILTMTQAHQEALRRRFPHKTGVIYTLKEYAGIQDGSLDVEDPFGGDEARYRRAAAEIQGLLEKVLERWEKEEAERGEKVSSQPPQEETPADEGTQR